MSEPFETCRWCDHAHHPDDREFCDSHEPPVCGECKSAVLTVIDGKVTCENCEAT